MKTAQQQATENIEGILAADTGTITPEQQAARNEYLESQSQPTATLPVEPRTDQDLIEGFEKFKQLNPDSLSGTGIAALIEGTLPDGTPITFSGGAESSAFNEYLKSLGLSRADIFTPTMADVAGPATQGLIPGFTAKERSDGRLEYTAPDGQVYGPDTYADIAAGMYPNIYKGAMLMNQGGRVGL